jgi:hypothetical protein
MPSSPDGRERRKLKRIVQRIPARFSTATAQGAGHVKNLCKEGLFLRTDALPEPGEQVQVLILTRERLKIEVLGTVRWTTDQLPDSEEVEPGQEGFGVLIEAPSEEFREFFADLLLK